jgi:hypothetical protein
MYKVANSSTRTRAALATLVLLVSATRAAAQADPPAAQTIRSQTGVSFSLPERFLPEPLAGPVRAPIAGSPVPVVEHVFVDGDTPTVRVVVSHIAIDAAAALRELPTRSGPLPEAFARGYVDGMLRTSQASSVVPGEYDAERHAFSARIHGRTPSPARLLAVQPLESPTWRQLASTGGDAKLTHCLLDQLLADGDGFEASQARARYPRVLQNCTISEASLDAYVKAQQPNFFMGARLLSLAINYVMPTAMTVVTVSGPPAQTAALEALLSSIWTSAQVAGSAEHEPSRMARLLGFSQVQLPRLLGVATGAVLIMAAMMALFGWLLTKLRVPVVVALLVPTALLLGLALLDMATSTTPSAYLTGKLLAYALSAALLARPLWRRLAARHYA